MSLVNNSANNFKDFLDAIKPYLNYQFYDLSGQGVEANNFSTDEKVIGTWIDGKPLYQKTIYCGSGPTGLRNPTMVDSGLTNEMCIDMTAFAYRQSDKRFLSVPYVSSADSETINNVQYNLSICYYGDTHKIEISSGYDRSNTNIYVTLRYTKTTDSAVASGEKIVGQWIDGKPVFEKAFRYTSTTINSWVDYDISSLNIGKIISLTGCATRAFTGYKAYMPFGYYETDGVTVYSSMARVRSSNNTLSIRLNTASGESTDEQIVILRYTKSS